jgi:hypothetical protein
MRLMTSDSAKTVQSELMVTLEPCRASSTRAPGLRPIELAMTSRNRPVPAEHLSFITKSLTFPSETLMIFVS